MKNSIGIVFGMLLFLSCVEHLIEKPENLIPEDKMVLILKEMAVLNAAKATNLGKLKDNGIEPTTFIFEKYKIDSAQYVDSDRYYSSLPLVYESFYKQVELRLEKQRVDLEADKKLRDSLNAAKNSAKKGIGQKTKDSLSSKNVPQ